MYYTYILRSLSQPGAIYIGYTHNLKDRLKEHNNSKSHYISRRYAPWEVESYLVFTYERDAKDFEIYLKSNSGKAFLRKRLISQEFKEALAKFNNGRAQVSETK